MLSEHTKNTFIFMYFHLEVFCASLCTSAATVLQLGLSPFQKVGALATEPDASISFLLRLPESQVCVCCIVDR